MSFGAAKARQALDDLWHVLEDAGDDEYARIEAYWKTSEVHPVLRLFREALLRWFGNHDKWMKLAKGEGPELG
jgi:hypothetical protein